MLTSQKAHIDNLVEKLEKVKDKIKTIYFWQDETLQLTSKSGRGNLEQLFPEELKSKVKGVSEEEAVEG